jgi:hypothetical protein
MFFGKKNKQQQAAPQSQFHAAAATTEKPFDMSAFRGMWDSTASASYSPFSNSPSNSNAPKHSQNVL